MRPRKTGGRKGRRAFEQSQKSTAKTQPGTIVQPQADFASRMTKSIFGRFYWDDVLEQEKQHAMIEKKKQLEMIEKEKQRAMIKKKKRK